MNFPTQMMSASKRLTKHMLRLPLRHTALALPLIALPVAAQAQEGPVAVAVEVQEVEAPASQQVDADSKAAKRKAMQIVRVTQAFLKTLSDEQKEKASLDFDSDQRVGWHFIPKDSRKGVPLKEMNAEQKEAAMLVLRAAVSKLGYEKSTQIMQLESVLKKLEGDKGRNERNPEKYYFTVFGQPKFKQRWGLSVEGHHLSLNFVFNGNKVLDSTPQFFATNPATLKDDFGDGFPKGLQVLKAEEQLGFKLVRSLDDSQKEKAMLPGDTPSEIRAAGEAQPPTESLGGITTADLNDEQKATLKKLLTAYTAKMKPLVAKERWKLIEEAGMDKVTFGWSGATRPGVGHYYVIQGPTFLVEFINVQPDAAGNPANHVHCVWRDMGGDFDLSLAGK